MECEVTASPTYGGAGKAGNNATSKSSPTPTSTASRNSLNSSAGKSSLHVEFSEMGEVKHNREKYLTAKYGSHQMSLIRKRLSVEMWLYDELQKLYEDEDGAADASSSQEVEIDLDEVLDMEGDDERRKFLLSLLVDAKKSTDVVNKFIEDVLEKAKTL